MADELERKYDVKILTTEDKVKFPDELKEQLKSSGLMDAKGKLNSKSKSKNAQKNEARVCRVPSN